MKKYFIPICMTVGGLVGMLIGLIVNFAVLIVAFAGAALGIIVGAVLQMVTNQTYPDEYFERKREVADTSLFSETDIAYREAAAAESVYRDNKAVEDIDINDFLSDKDKEKQKRMRQEQLWEEQARQAQLRREQQRRGVGTNNRKSSMFNEPVVQSKDSGKSRVVVEEDDD